MERPSDDQRARLAALSAVHDVMKAEVPDELTLVNLSEWVLSGSLPADRFGSTTGPVADVADAGWPKCDDCGQRHPRFEAVPMPSYVRDRLRSALNKPEDATDTMMPVPYPVAAVLLEDHVSAQHVTPVSDCGACDLVVAWAAARALLSDEGDSDAG